MADYGEETRGPVLISVAYLISAIATGSVIAIDQMNLAHSGGSDTTFIWLAICGLAALVGGVAVIMLIRRPTTNAANAGVSLVATIFAVLIFSALTVSLVYRGVPSGSRSTPLPRTGANS